MGSLLLTALLALLVLIISRIVVSMEARHRDYQLGLQRGGAVPENQVATLSTTALPTEEPIKRRGSLWVVFMGLIRMLVSVPIAIVATLAAVPLWWLLERITGWHIIGHSGPDEWCYVFVYAIVLLIYFGRLRSTQQTNRDLP